jgi:hypothetical protein
VKKGHGHQILAEGGVDALEYLPAGLAKTEGADLDLPNPYLWPHSHQPGSFSDPPRISLRPIAKRS